jgi:hypothetical protein
MSPKEMQDKILAGLQAKTGKNVEQWSRAVKKAGLGTRKERVEWLMTEHGVGRVAANLIASHAEGKSGAYDDGNALVEKMFAGPKASLRPLYDQIVRSAASLGKDVTVQPCQTQVTLRRKRQFAWIKPSTRTRLDLGLALGDLRPAGRLQPVTGTDEDDRVRVRIPITAPEEIDGEVRRWIKAAYDLDA